MSTIVNREHLPYLLDGGVAERAAIGLIVLATDHTIEHEWRQIIPRLPGVGVFGSRIMNSPEINPETLAAMQAGLADCTAVLRPGERIDVVGYACTSGAMVIGPENVAARVHTVRPGIPVTNPMTAAITALQTMGARRIALLTPYVESVNRAMRAHVEAHDLEVPVMGSFNLADDNAVARISEASLEEAIVALAADPSVDAGFVACTSLRVCAIVERAEARLAKPVTSSNHALAWHCLRLAGVRDELDGLMAAWVDPVNNLVSADLDGNISYRTVGRIPVRDPANRWGPVPGGTGVHEWRGVVAFEDLPHLQNPEDGILVTANQQIVADDSGPYLGLDYARPDRAPGA